MRSQSQVEFLKLNMKIQRSLRLDGVRLVIITLVILSFNISIGFAQKSKRCYNTNGLFADSVLTQLVSVTFEDMIKIKDCESLETKKKSIDDDEPPDVIKVPPKMTGKALDVFIHFYLEDISHIDEEQMQFRIDYYMVQSWIAQRKYCNSYRKLLKNLDVDLLMFNDSSDMLEIDADFLKFFWTPDSFIVNAKLVTTQSSHPTTKSLLMFVSDNTEENGGDDTGGKICNLKVNGRFTATIPCAMDFRNYPVDVQNCAFHIRSFSFPVDEMRLKWTEEPVLRKLFLPQHDSQLTSSNATYVNILNARQYYERNYTLEDIPEEQQFTLLTINIRLSRDISNKIAAVYIPTALICIVCFSTFWFGSKSISDRVTVGVTALLAFITQFIETRRYIAPISVLNWMDIWMLLCMVFVFIQLVEGTIVHYYYIEGKKLIRLRRKNIKRTLKVFEQETDQPVNNKLSGFVNSNKLIRKTLGKWRKPDHEEPLTYEEPPTKLLINRFRYANQMYRKEKFLAKRTGKNQVHFDSNVTYLSNGNGDQSEDKNRRNQLNQLKPAELDSTELNQISYSLDSPVLNNNSTSLNTNRSNTGSNAFPEWSKNIDIRTALSGAEMRNLDLLQLLSDESIKNWLTEIIYPYHVNFGLLSVIKHYWKLLFHVDLPRTSAHYYSLQVDKYARVFVPLLYLLCLGVYVLMVWTCMEVDNEATLENIFAYKENPK